MRPESRPWVMKEESAIFTGVWVLSNRIWFFFVFFNMGLFFSLSLSFLKNYFNWRIITLQYCVGFLQDTSMNEPQVCVWALPCWTYLSPHTLSRWIWPPCVIQQIPTAAFNSTCGTVYVSMLLSPIFGPSPSLVPTSLFSASASPLLPFK